MAIQCARQPIIIMGMARSGTTLISDLLHRLGLFIGHRRIEVDQEATYFYSVNRMLLKRVHGYWDNPAPMRYFLKNSTAVDLTVRCMETDIVSHRVISYLGLRHYLKYRSLQRFDKPWGWKDPRNVFTLPLWLKLFPEAKIVYIVRNGVDVANSLVVMEQRVTARREARAQKRFGKMTLRGNLERVGFKGAVRCLSLEGGFSLWEEYVSQAEVILGTIKNDRRVIKFEDLLDNPKVHLLELHRFCGLEVESDKTIDEVASRVNGERANAFVQDSPLAKFYSGVKLNPWMIHHGYSNLVSSG